MSDCELIAQVAHDKWAIVSDLLRSLRSNDQMSESLGLSKLLISLFRSQKMSYSLKKFEKITFFNVFYSFFLLKFFKKSKRFCSFLLSKVSESLRALRTNERSWAICSVCLEGMRNRERIAQVAHQKWVNERIAHFFEQITHSLIFGQKSSDSLRKPMNEFPALMYSIKNEPFCSCVKRDKM